MYMPAAAINMVGEKTSATYTAEEGKGLPVTSEVNNLRPVTASAINCHREYGSTSGVLIK